MTAKPAKTILPVWTSRYLPPALMADQVVGFKESGVVDDIVLFDQMTSWYPSWLWTDSSNAAAAVVPDYDSFPDTWALGGYLSRAAPGLGLTVGIDAVRQGPGEMMRAMLTLANLTEGRTTFAIGAGEIKHCKPFGWNRSQGVKRLEDHFHIYRELLDNDGPVSYEGNHWTFDRAWIGDAKQNRPRFWGMGGGPRLIDLTTSYADGMSTALPSVWSSPARARTAVESIRQQVADKGRDPQAFELGAYFLCLIHEDRDAIDRAMDNPLVKWMAAVWGRLDTADWVEQGIEPAVPEGWHYAMKLLPTHMSRADVEEIIARTSRELVERAFVIGTPHEVAEQMQAFADVGIDAVSPLDLLSTVLDPEDAAQAPARSVEVARLLKQGVPAIASGNAAA